MFSVLKARKKLIINLIQRGRESKFSVKSQWLYFALNTIKYNHIIERERERKRIIRIQKWTLIAFE